MVLQKMSKTIRSEEISQIAMLQDVSQIKGDSVNSVRCEANRHSGTKKEIF
jgi:hypothetical protein